MEIDIERARRELSYDPETGLFRWLISKRGPVKVGDAAGSRAPRGYWRVKIGQKAHLAHRLAWAMHYGEQPPPEIDHRDHDRMNNRIGNLRSSTRLLNCINRAKAGVRYEADRGRWLARISIDGKAKNLGRFSTKEEAEAAYFAARDKHYGEILAG